MNGILIDLFDYSGNAADPYRKAGWEVIQIDIKLGVDILTWNYKKEITKAVNENWFYSTMPKIGLLAAIPCTDYALSGAAHFAKKDIDGRTAKSQLLVDKVYEIKKFLEDYFAINFWRVENPMSRIHKLNTWLGPVKFKFNPCDFSGYLDTTEAERARLYEIGERMDMSTAKKEDIKKILDANLYNKQTWLWGNFNIPALKYNQPVYKEFPGHILYGGKSEATKEKRSVDPKGFCMAFYEANH